MSDTRKLAAILVAAGRRSRARLSCGKKSRDDRPAKVGTERRRRVNSWIGRG